MADITSSKLVAMSLERATSRLTDSLVRHGFEITASIGMRSLKEASDGTRTGGFRIISARFLEPPSETSFVCNVLVSELAHNRVKVATTDIMLPIALPYRQAISEALAEL